MSQAGIINVIDSNPTIPIYFEADTGFAVALFNVIRIVGTGGITTSATGNTITIDGSGEGSDCICVEITDSTTLLVNSCNYTNFVEGENLTLPSTAEVCDTIEVNYGLQGVPTIVQNAGQQIRFGNTTSTVGVTGGMTATGAGDCIKLKCITGGANTLWEVISSVGTWNVF